MNTVNSISTGSLQVYQGLKYGCQQAYSGVRKLADAGKYIVTETEPLERCAKFSYKTIDFAATLAGIIGSSIPASLGLLGKQLKGASDLFEGVGFFFATYLLIGGREKTSDLYLWQNPKNSMVKIADRVFLCAHKAFKLAISLDRYQFIDLGKIGRYSIGELSIFKGVSDGLMVIRSFFSFADNNTACRNARKTINNANEKIDKWEYRPTVVALLRVGNKEEIAEVKRVYQDKAKAAREELVELAKDKKRIEENIKGFENPKIWVTTRDKLKAQSDLTAAVKKIQKLEHMLPKYDARVAKLENGNYKAVAEELSKPEKIAYKVQRWEVVKENAQVDNTKGWIKIAGAISKIVVITLALYWTAVNLWAIPVLALPVIFFGMTSDGCSIVKLLYEHYHQEKIPLPLRPAGV